MNLRVTVGATPIEYKKRLWALGGGGMPGLHMAALAEPGFLHHQHFRVAGAMGVVAVSAILHHRRVLPEEWSSFIRMAFKAGFIHGIGGQ
jgi:hypothetical protein